MIELSVRSFAAWRVQPSRREDRCSCWSSATRRERPRGRLVDDLRAARQPPGAARLLRRHRGGALQRDAGPPLPHTVLRIGYNYNGLTEIGGLVLLPEPPRPPRAAGQAAGLRPVPVHGLHRASFRDEVVSELMPPLEPDGTSLLWEALGRHFTGLTYQEADRLSRENKEFIRTLFPQDPHLRVAAARAASGADRPGRARQQAGRAHAARDRLPATPHRIDPFDGGPHFHARTDEITPGARTRTRARRRAEPLRARAPAVAGASGRARADRRRRSSWRGVGAVRGQRLAATVGREAWPLALPADGAARWASPRATGRRTSSVGRLTPMPSTDPDRRRREEHPPHAAHGARGRRPRRPRGARAARRRWRACPTSARRRSCSTSSSATTTGLELLRALAQAARTARERRSPRS